MAAEANLEANEEVDVLYDEGVNKATKVHTNLQVFILNLLPKVYSIHTKIGSSSVAKSVV